ncbi:hypothetical protein [Thiorhodovibrio frisius]|uniref:Uncharacterized protein n=1 Tax=Thiorhodovibrio frisius TaxID=631362 RepID=H8Z665_9GAMM|nr:hypothetical protein [Thiorhodovibrio frisius]EIC19632.1 hypothetical protein Thi970DRAFT_03219 [Thiorhodovibrio frisius]WPL20402.1 hypothetical protein Thiofri_00492 [Thiorhodovibrio frisius]
MTADARIINAIANEINALRTGTYDEVIFDEAIFVELPEPDYFLSPDPDVYDGPDNERLPDEFAGHPHLLGVYVPMHSPGRVILLQRNLHRFYWSLIAQTRRGLPYLTKLDLLGALDLVVMQTYQHELFHFHCDVLRQLLGGHSDPMREEALAVAWSRQRILNQAWNSRIGRMNRVFYHRLLDAAFAYRSPGYRDWPLFADDARFRPALLDYLATSASVGRLQTSGVANLADLVTGMLGNISGGYKEYVR